MALTFLSSGTGSSKVVAGSLCARTQPRVCKGNQEGEPHAVSQPEIAVTHSQEHSRAGGPHALCWQAGALVR